MYPVEKEQELVTEAGDNRAKRYAEEVEAICRLASEGPGDVAIEEVTDPISRLLTLCNLIPGTDSLKEYLRIFLSSGGVREFPRHIHIDVDKGAYGLFTQSLVQQFELMQILIHQPVNIDVTLKSGDKDSAKKLYRRLKRWKNQYERKYEEKVAHGINMSAIEKELKRVSPSLRNIE